MIAAHPKAGMAYKFGSLVFSSTVQALQEKYGSRRAYAKQQAAGEAEPPIGPAEEEFIAERDSFYMATVGEGGWPYVQHRGGPKGFLKVIDNHTLAFADLRGNRQYISTGNLMENDRVALIMVDYPRQARLKILGRARILDAKEAPPWIDSLKNDDGVVERVFTIAVEASDWNCPQHITPRFTADEIRDAIQPWEQRFEALQKENEELRRRLESKAESPQS